MKKMNRSTVGILALVLVASLTACSASHAAPKATDEFSAIKSTGTMQVGIEAAYPPFNFFDKQNNLQGFDVDVTQAIAKKMGIKVQYVPTPWESIIGGLLAKKYDIIISSMAITDARKQTVAFTDPYYHTGSQLFAHTNTTITDPTQLTGKKIGVAIGTTFAIKAKELGATVVTYTTDLLAFEDVQNGRLDGLLTDGPVGNYAIKQHGYDIKQVGTPLIQAAAGIAMRKSEPAFLAAVNKALKEIQTDGTYTSISQKWFGTDIR
jgi:ABC-type amino acid transport substrate-binding protein